MDEGDEEEEKEDAGGKGGRGGETGGIRNEEDDVEKETRLDARGMLRRGDMMGGKRGIGGTGRRGRNRRRSGVFED